MKRILKRTIVAALALAMLLSLAACGKQNEDTADGGESTGYKDTFTFAQAADISSLDPNETAIVTLDVICAMYDTLVKFDKDMKIQPSLAKEWTKEDELTWVFTLRDDVTFQNGDPMTADDVIFSIKRAAGNAKTASLFSALSDAVKVDDYTVKFILSEPSAVFLNNLANVSSAILPSKYMQENGDDILKTAPIGTGAYKFVEWKQGNYVKFEANENYWNGEVPTKYLVMKVIPEASQRTIALETGEIDVAYGIQANDIAKIEEQDGLVLFNQPSLTTTFVTMNFEKPGMDDQRVREAIRLAIDSEVLTEAIYYGAAEADNTIIPFNAFGYQADAKELKQDQEEAKRLLAEAGYADGFKTNIYTSDTQSAIEICQIIQAQLKEVGIDCEIKTSEFGTFLDKVSKGEHDMCLMTWSTSTVDADFTYYAQFHSNQYGIYGNMMKPGLFPGLDENIEKARNTSDEAIRMEAYKNVETILAENSIYRPLICRNVVVGATDKVEGFEVHANDIHDFLKVKVAN